MTTKEPATAPAVRPSREWTTYRPDIDGMRALAVLVVLGFHLHVPWTSGGYVGVDVFFVLSGYLITGIVLAQIRSDRFQLRRFYGRRVRRLVPPLVATIVGTGAAAAVVMQPQDLQAFARSGIAALVSLSNVLFFAEAGYWDTTAELKPLLHTWSLGVEEQFYLLWPLGLLLLARVREHRRARALLAVTVVATLVALVGFTVTPDGAFYLTPFRVFQFAVGGWLRLVPTSRIASVVRGWRADAASVLGLVLLLASVVGFDAMTPYPGGRALVPTLATGLLLAVGAAAPHAVGLAPLSTPAATWLGLRSYALYLAHWPLISLYRYATGLELRWAEQAMLGLGSLLLALVLHHGVERRFYQRHGDVGRPRLGDGRFALRVAAVSTSVAIVLGVWTVDGWSSRFPTLTLTPDAIAAGEQARFELVREGCTLHDLAAPACDPTATTRVLTLGNSHEPDAYNFLVGGWGDDPDVQVVAFGTTNGCELERGPDRWRSPRPACDDRLSVLQEPSFLDELDVLVYAAHRPFAANKQTFLDLLADLHERAPHLRVVTLGGYIETAEPCARLVNETGTTSACAAPDNVVYFAGSPEDQPLHDAFAALTDHYVDRVALLCDGSLLERCATASSDGAPMTYDAHHHSLPFALEAGAAYAEDHPDLLTAATAG